MISYSEVKKGVIVKVDGDIYLVTRHEVVKPGKGSAFNRVKLKSIEKGSVIERTFKDSEKVEDVQVDKRKMSFSYEDGDDLVFMDTEDYEQHHIPKNMVDDLLGFLKENMEVDIQMYEGRPLAVLPPNFVEMEVTYAEEGLKGDTSGTATKRVTVETGGEIQVPIFVKQGDRIKIDLRDISYVERVK